MSNGSSHCKSCQKPITWVTAASGWIPLDPKTRERHRCQLDRVCEDCGASFKGATWMKQCPACFKPQRRRIRKAPEPDYPQRDAFEDDENGTPF